MARPKGNDVEHFWSHVETGRLDECWIWKGAKRGKTTYGLCIFRGKKQSAHRVSYQINIGPIPEGLEICHRCDNPSCVNPAHLFAGTHTDNMRDMSRKGRNPAFFKQGERHPLSKLTKEKVLDIRRLIRAGMPLRAIAERHGVSEPAISYINTGETWSHVQLPPDE